MADIRNRQQNIAAVILVHTQTHKNPQVSMAKRCELCDDVSL